jgi:hypothetical protein
VLPLFVVVLVALLAMMALAVDFGFALTARSEAQRVADSSSLAGASIFIDESGVTAVPEAKRLAKEYAARNGVRGEIVDTTWVSSDSFFNEDGFEVFQDVTNGMTVQVIPGEYKVRVWVRREGLGTWFGRVIGHDFVDVQAMAAAVASAGGTTDNCVLPFAMPDIWHDEDNDLNGNRLPDGEGELAEDWEYDPAEGDVYEPWDGTDADNNGKGYGSNWRDGNGTTGDVGTKIWIKAGPPGQSGGAGGTDDPVGPGNFEIWQMPDPDNNCEPRSGADWVRANITTCNTCPIGVGADYPHETQPGNIASIKDSLLVLMNQDPDAEWNDDTGEVVCNGNWSWDDWRDSPRTRIVPLWSPQQALQGQGEIFFNNFARIFLEEGGTEPPDFAIRARFVGAVTGGPEGPETGTLVRYLRLVE